VGAIDEKRQDRRHRVLRKGKIVFNSGSSLIDCVIRDQSLSGAKLRVPAPTELPKTFELLCVAEETLYPAETMWRLGDELGVAFVGEPRRAPPHCS
jgi:hypothetical protein